MISRNAWLKSSLVHRSHVRLLSMRSSISGFDHKVGRSAAGFYSAVCVMVMTETGFGNRHIRKMFLNSGSDVALHILKWTLFHLPDILTSSGVPEQV